MIDDLKYLDQTVDAVEPIVKNGDEAAEMAADILKKNGLGDIAEDIIKNSDEASNIVNIYLQISILQFGNFRI